MNCKANCKETAGKPEENPQIQNTCRGPELHGVFRTRPKASNVYFNIPA